MLNDPFQTGRNATRLLFDFSIGLSCMDFNKLNNRVLDFACGTGWSSEFLNKLGFDVYGFDIDKDVVNLAKNRYKSDARIDNKRMHFSIENGHKLSYRNNYFGHIFCFDSLHHMKDFKKVFKEIYRVLEKDGIALFIEPGSRHADSEETKKFLKEHSHGKYWIERSIDLQEMNKLSNETGFIGFSVKPFLNPNNISYSFTDWVHLLKNKKGIATYMNEFRRFNYEDRVIFYLTK